MAVGGKIPRALVFPCPRAGAGHIGLRAGFVQENQMARLRLGDAFQPCLALKRYIGTPLLARV